MVCGLCVDSSIVGVLFAGILSDKLGRKRTMILSAILFSMSAIGCAVCADFNQLVVYRIVGGVGIGVVSIVSLFIYPRLSVSSVSWTLGITLSISGYHWLFRSLSNELSVAYVC